MDAKEAANAAKEYIIDVFGADEEADGVGLEEVQFDDHLEVWDITIGLFRPWQRANLPLLSPGQRTYKVVRIDDSNGRITSVTNRTFAAMDSA